MTTKPQRIQLSRAAGFNLQQHSRSINGLPAVKVDRTTVFGNPYTDGPKDMLVQLFRDHVRDPESRKAQIIRDRLPELKGKNIACWCAPPAPGEPDACHGAVLLEIANAPDVPDLKRPTEAQAKALAMLDRVDYATPADIGTAVTGGKKKNGAGMKAQGLGRIGGAMAARLIRLGWASNASHLRDGFAAYRITGHGRTALTAMHEGDK